MKDIITDVLESVKFRSAVYFKHGFCGAWGMDAKKSQYAQFHFVVEGNCILYIDDDRFELSNGDLVMLPNGYPHKIQSRDVVECQPGSMVVQKIIDGINPFENGSINANLICGHYELDREISHFILSELPEFIIIRNADYGRVDLLNTVLNLFIDEMEAKNVGYDLITLRLAEVVFISILRHYYLNQEGSKFNLFRDEAIYRSLNFIHSHIADDLSIDILSRHSQISRTLFINRFKKVVGNTPLGYIKTWRMSKAKQWLKYTDFSISQISEQAGYSSPSAFNRVFKQTFQISPKKYRDQELVS